MPLRSMAYLNMAACHEEDPKQLFSHQRGQGANALSPFSRNPEARVRKALLLCQKKLSPVNDHLHGVDQPQKISGMACTSVTFTVLELEASNSDGLKK